MSLAPGFGGTYFEGTGEDAALTVGEGEDVGVGTTELVHAVVMSATVQPSFLTAPMSPPRRGSMASPGARLYDDPGARKLR